MNEFDRQRWKGANPEERAGRIFAIYKLAGGITPPLAIPKGVHKFRSIEEMNAFKDRYEQARVDLLRAQREKK